MMLLGSIFLVLSALLYFRLQLRALLSWRGLRRVLAVMPLIGWMVFYQQAQAASPDGYITDNLLPIDLWCAFVNGAAFLFITGRIFERRNAWSGSLSSR